VSFDETEVGDRLTTPARTVTEADLVNFAGVSGDFNYLHTDAERMAQSDFGERIAHGALVFSMMTGLLWQARESEDVVAFYGIDRLRFRAPTLVGDTIHVETEVVETEPSDHPEASGVVREEAEVETDDGTVVLSCELLALVR
jgi:acyl dehydratase